MNSQEEAKVTQAHLEQFSRHWANYDPRASRLMPIAKLQVGLAA
jgi:hypothetical protein